MPDIDEILAGRDAASVEAKEQDVTTPDPAQSEPVSGDDAETGEQQAGESENSGTVPQAAIHAERQKNAKRYTEQVAEFERRMSEQNQLWQQRFEQQQAQFNQLVAAIAPKQPPQQQQAPDPYTDLEAYVAHAQTPIMQRLEQIEAARRAQWEQDSLYRANEKYGADVVNGAYSAIEELKRANPNHAYAVYQGIMSSPHPYEALVQWDRRQKALAEIGDDPDAYKAKIKAELEAELKSGLSPAAQPQGVVPGAMPSNFATGRSVGARSGPQWSGPAAISDIFDFRDRGKA